MKIRLHHARVLTMEPNRPIFTGEVWVEDGRITHVKHVKEDDEAARAAENGRSPSVSEAGLSSGVLENGLGYMGMEDGADGEKMEADRTGIWDQEIDCGGNLLLPGFKNAHTHSGMTFLRSMADDLPLQEWLNDRVFPLEAKLTGEDIYQLTKLAILEYLTSGITGIFDMYLDPAATARACRELGMRCVLVSGLNNFTSSLEKMEEEYRTWNPRCEDGGIVPGRRGGDTAFGCGAGGGASAGGAFVGGAGRASAGESGNSLISYRLGVHAEYTCSRELLEGVAALSHKLKAPVYLHLAETEKEVAECKGRYGQTPAVLLDSLGLFDYGGGGYHCVHMTEADLEVFQKRGLYVITNPASNLKLASGIAPIAEFDRRGIPVAIGTDGPASNNCLDMFREMFLVTALSKLREGDASSMDAEKVLRMATVQGARAMGLWDCDVLAEGKRADLVLIDLHQPNMQPLHNIPKNLVYSGSKSNVAMTMIDGKVLYRKGTFFVGEEPERIYENCQAIVRRLVTAF